MGVVEDSNKLDSLSILYKSFFGLMGSNPMIGPKKVQKPQLTNMDSYQHGQLTNINLDFVTKHNS